MKKRELDHVLQAAGRITGEKQFIIIGKIRTQISRDFHTGLDRGAHISSADATHESSRRNESERDLGGSQDVDPAD